MPDRPVPPVALRRPVEITHHDHTRVDEYAWLRDPDWREAMRDPDRLDPAIREYLVAENAYADAVTVDTRALESALFTELRGRIREDDASVPLRDGTWYYYSRYREGGQHPLLCRRGAEGDEQVLLDGDAEAADAAYFRLGGAEHSPDHRYLAYAVDAAGAEVFEIRVCDLETGEDLPDRIGDCNASFVWAADSCTLLYTRIDGDHRSRWVHRHTLGERGPDPLVYEEQDAGFFLGVDKTESGRYLLIDSHDHTTSEVYYLPADDPSARPTVFAPRRAGTEYGIADRGEAWYILTNAGDAEDFRICTAPLDDHAPERWRTLVAHEPGRLIQGMLLFRDYLVRQELQDAVPRIVVHRLEDGAEHAIEFSEACYSVGLSAGFEFVTDTLRFAYSSFTTPAEVYDYDMAARTRTLRKRQEVPSGHDPAAYVSERLTALAPDGEAVPVSLFHRRDCPPGPDTPLLLYGYGAYGISDLPSFSPNRLSLVDRGVTYAIAHVRGGMERGYRWYREGRMADKPNTFSDYIASAETLIGEGRTGRGRLIAHGGSAGGMLVGAVLNQRPELFGAAVADVPFVDVLNTMLDETLPLTPPEWPEWGNPLDDETAYFRILSYSPYDNVAEQAYPPLLVTAGVSDPRVTYWEPAKWVARLRARATGDAPLVLRTNMSAGHGGPGGRFQYLEEVAQRYAFILRALGIE
ncbi:S9 family peptidase [Arhodomonas aquaeolei]|uniref:S9 family peptidase n=1 Tax=Arhodomonas aquaeolei TaxID=2369 RepID=UPI0021697A42|nr:S9 family peptidase [Arhodomonas aquaeolei]MCS4503536.1 S9 family peptidase [Arhodomonas aquaeolei]